MVIPGDAGEAFDSLWVRDLLTNRGFELEVPAGQSVTDVWWTDAGLMFRVVPSAGYTGEYVDGPFAIYQVSDGTTATVIHQDGMSPSATPAATPLDPRL